MAARAWRSFSEKELGLPGLRMLGHYRQAASQGGLAPHAHGKAIEICFLERGEQTYRVGGTVYRLRGNDQFFTRAGEVHDTAGLPQERGVLYWLILSLERDDGFLGLAPALGNRLQQELRKMPVRHFAAHPDCTALLGEMIGRLEREKPGVGRSLRLQGLVVRYLVRTIESSQRNARAPASPVIERVRAHVEKHLEEPIEVAVLARVARLSESRFKARFKEEIGVPPAEFWLRQKIERARNLLRKGEAVTEVAYRLGFSSSQYFATAFRRYTLLTPSEYASPHSIRDGLKAGRGNSGTD
jgi:AraC-like DNA-binding protein